MLACHVFFFIWLRMFAIDICCLLYRVKNLLLKYHGKMSGRLCKLMNYFLLLFLGPPQFAITFTRENHPRRKAAAGAVCTCLRCKVQQFSLKCWQKLVWAKKEDFVLRHVQVLHPCRPAVERTGQTKQLEGFCLLTTSAQSARLFPSLSLGCKSG